MGKKRGILKLDLSNDIEPIESPKPISKPKVSFQAWFIQKTNAGKLRFYQDEAVLVFFKKNGLSESECNDTYNECFKRF